MLAAQVILVFPLIMSSLAGPMNPEIFPVTNGIVGTEGDKYAGVEINLDKVCPNVGGLHDEVHDRIQVVPPQDFCDCLAHLRKCDLLRSKENFNQDEFDQCTKTLKHHGEGCVFPSQGSWSGRLYKHEHITVKDWMTCDLLCQMDKDKACTGWSFGAKNDENPNKKTCYLMAENGARQPAQRNMVSGLAVNV